MTERAAKLVKAIQNGVVTLEEVLAIPDLSDADKAAIVEAS